MFGKKNISCQDLLPLNFGLEMHIQAIQQVSVECSTPMKNGFPKILPGSTFHETGSNRKYARELNAG